MVNINKIIKITAGKFHAWCDSDFGVIRKPNKAIPDFIWDSFFNRELNLGTISAKEIKIDKNKPSILEPELKWYQKLWNWIKKKVGVIKLK